MSIQESMSFDNVYLIRFRKSKYPNLADCFSYFKKWSIKDKIVSLNPTNPDDLPIRLENTSQFFYFYINYGWFDILSHTSTTVHHTPGTSSLLDVHYYHGHSIGKREQSEEDKALKFKYCCGFSYEGPWNEFVGVLDSKKDWLGHFYLINMNNQKHIVSLYLNPEKVSIPIRIGKFSILAESSKDSKDS